MSFDAYHHSTRKACILNSADAQGTASSKTAKFNEVDEVVMIQVRTVLLRTVSSLNQTLIDLCHCSVFLFVRHNEDSTQSTRCKGILMNLLIIYDNSVLDVACTVYRNLYHVTHRLKTCL